MSKIFVDQVDPKTATTLTLGTSGDTVSIPSGVTIANSGTATGFGVSLANGVDNRVVTATSATALNGETNLIYNGTILGVGAAGSGADLGSGVHVRKADSGGSVMSDNDALVLEGSAGIGMTLLGGTADEQTIAFGDSGDSDIGYIKYHHYYNYMAFGTNATEQLRIDSDGSILSQNMSDTNGHQFYGTWTSGNNTLFNWIDGSGNTCGTIGMDATNNTSSYNTSSDYRLILSIILLSPA